MFVFGNFLSAIATVIDIILTVYMWIIIGRAIISWVNPDPHNQIVRFLYSASEPVLRPVRRMLPTGMGLDLSPIVVIAAIYFFKIFVVRSLMDLSLRLH